MRIYSKNTVFEESLNRIRFIYQEFDSVIVSTSTGKDSTVILELARAVCKERGEKVKALFLDQEAEWQYTVDYARRLKDQEGVELMWYQPSFKLFNVTSQEQHYLHSWEEGADWMRPKEPDRTEIDFPVSSFHSFFPAFAKAKYKGQRLAFLSGLRTEESPGRFMGATAALTYKDVTWGKRLNKPAEHYTFHPIYDWSYTDVWKAIFSNQWDYNKLYDRLYQMGVGIRKMRVSNLTNDTALRDLAMIQEIEPETYAALTSRLRGIKTAGRMGDEGGYFLKDLPFMFLSWQEYTTHLLDKLIEPADRRAKFSNRFKKVIARLKKNGTWEGNEERFWKACAKTAVLDDHYFTKLDSFEDSLNLSLRREGYNFFNKDELKNR